MPIALRGTPTTANAGGGGPQTLAITLPTGIVSGDVIYVYISTDTGTSPTTTKTFVTVGTSSISNDGRFAIVLRRVSDGTEGSSLTFDSGTGNYIQFLQCRAYSGANTTTPEDTGGNSIAVGNTGTIATVPGITTHAANAELVFFACDDNIVLTFGTPTGFGNAKTDTDSGNTTSSGGWDKTQAVAGATGTVSATGMTAGNVWQAFLFAIQPAAVSGNLPLPIYPHHRPARTRQIPHVRAKHPVRDNRALFVALPAKFPFPIVHHAQKRRIPVVKPKPRVRNRWLDERQVTAPHADFPEQIRRQAQKRRIPLVKAKPKVRSSIELRIPQAPHPDFPAALRHGRNQPKRIPRITAKRVVRSSIELRIPGPLRLQNPVAAHRGQKHRIPVVKAKRAVRSSLELRIPQAPSPTLPLSVRHQRGQTKRLPRVRAKATVRSSIELRIPPAPSATPPLPVEARRAQRKRLVPAARRQRRSFALFRVSSASVPSLIFGRHHRVRAPTVHPKRSVRGDIQLLIAPPPAAALPLPVRHARGQSRRLAKVQAKRVARSSIELRIPPPPPVIFPPALRHGRDQPKRIPRVKAKPAVRNSIELRIPPAVTPILPLPVRRARGQSRRFAKVHAKYVARNSIQLRIPQAPHPDFPQGIRRKTQRKPLFKVKAKQRVRSNIELRIPPAPLAFAPISIRGRAKHKFWRHIRAKAVVVSKFMQLSKTLAPFIPPPPPSPDILARWRNRGGPGASRIHGQG